MIEIGHLRDPADRRRMAELASFARELWRQPALAGLGAGEELKPGPVDDLEAWAVASAGSCHHASGTCRMGPNPDRGAVVDATGKVHGAEALYVADASVFPEIPAANTHLATIMVAERVAAQIPTYAPKASQPPSTPIVSPVTNRAPSEARNT